MSWISTLNETYEYLKDYEKNNPGKVSGIYPPGIITQNAHVDVVLDEKGEFLRASLIPKEDSQTPLPATIKSLARTSSPVPHVLFDNLLYVAGDIRTFIPEQRRDPYDEYFTPYIEQLEKWLSDSNNMYIRSVYQYLQQKRLTKDLIDSNVLQLDDKHQLDPKVKHQSSDQMKYLVRFTIQTKGETVKLWEEAKFLEEYSEYYINSLEAEDGEFCYATGKTGYMTELHGKNIRFAGDGAKLISANDDSGFTFRGRGDLAEEMLQISYESSEKAHSALRWLIRNQAYKKNGYTVVAWQNDTLETIQPMVDSDNIFGDPDDEEVLDTGDVFAKKLKRLMTGIKTEINSGSKVNIMALDAATPGRLSIQYYAEKQAIDYLDSILKWHKDLAWIHRFKTKKVERKGKEVNKSYAFLGAPSPYDIVLCAFGNEQSGLLKIPEKDKFVNQQLKRILPCIVDGTKLPRDFMRGAYANAIRPVSKEKYNWLKCLSVACSLTKKYYIDMEGEEYEMALDREQTDRSYLYGRLLAIADRIESKALESKKSEGGESKRQTTAMRYMEPLSKRPYKTWKNIELKLTPYWKMLNQNSASYYKKELNQVMELFEAADFMNNRALEPLFLLGYHCQSSDFYKSKKTEETSND